MDRRGWISSVHTAAQPPAGDYRFTSALVIVNVNTHRVTSGMNVNSCITPFLTADVRQEHHFSPYRVKADKAIRLLPLVQM